ncbi:MAG: hypothetical protein DRR16_16815 [Candidatus Parabeggiatoa sp. nov. 3]|nr:MAG: hypothetical protein DRR16_16815 [Gammaproteobacteria bacterium]
MFQKKPHGLSWILSRDGGQLPTLHREGSNANPTVFKGAHSQKKAHYQSQSIGPSQNKFCTPFIRTDAK